MAANFEVKFIVDRVSGNYKIQLTDTSTGFTLVKANTKITFPDGYVIENTDVSNPDISSAGGSVQKNLRLDVNNKPVTGDYTINFTGYDASDNEYTSQKQFNFTFSEPSIVIQDLSDSGVPVVKFKDITSWAQANFTASATTREFDVDYPSTSAISGTNKTQSETNLSNALEIDMVNNLNYYEGVYDVTLSVDITYTHTNGYLSVQYKRNSSNDFAIKKTPSQSDLLNKINQYKENIDEYKTTSPDVYAKYAEEYDNVLALYSHIVSRYKLGIGDGAQDSIEELLDLIEDQTVHVYLSTPLTSFSIDEDDFGANALITKLKSEIGTFDSDGNLETIAKAFADEVFEVDATDFKAEASKLSTLLAQFGTYDSETNTFSFLATADYFEQVKTYADDNSASAVALDILLAQFGTYDAETETFTFSSTADYFEEVKNYADNDKASAQALTTLTSQFGSYDPNTNTFTFDNTADYFDEVKTYADENSAAASKVSSIGSAFGSFDGNTFNFSEAKITQELNTYTGLDFSNSQYFIDIEAEIDSKPIVFRQASEPATTYAAGSLWYDTDNDNKVYILDGDPKTWTLTDDSRIGATATHLTTLTAAFGSYDPQTGLTIDTQADYFAEVKSYADTESASATKIENLGAELVTFDSNGNVTGVVLSSSFKSAIDTFVSDEDNSALASKVEGLRVDIEGEDGTGGITAQVTSSQQVIAARPKIFRQDAEPAITEPVGSLWFDTDDNNKAYVLTNGATPSWQVTRDEGLISDISDKPFIFRQDSEPATTNPEGSLWYDTNDGNKLYILISEVWTTTQDADIATAQATADGRPKVFRQDAEPATSNPEFSIWYDTDDNNLTYILLGDGGDPEQFSWTATIDGRVTDLLDFAESKYSLTADANGVVTGLELYSASGPNTTVSTFKITADKFIVRESSTDFVPFTLDGTQLKLDVPLNGVSGSFSGSLTAATGTFAGNVNGQVDGTSASTVKSGAADGATAKGVTDDLSSVVTITSTDIAIVNTDETKAFYNAGTPFYVDNNGDFSLGDKLKYDNSENLLTISGAVTIESVSGLTKSDVGLGNVDNDSTETILAGNLTGSVNDVAVSTVTDGAAAGATAKGVTDNLTSVVAITSSDIAIVLENETKTFNDDGTPFYVDNTGQFSLGDKLSYDPATNTLSITGAVTIESVSGLNKADVGLANVDNTSVANILDGTSGDFSGNLSGSVDGTAAATVKSGAADGASAKAETDKLTSVVTLTNSDIAIVNTDETKTFYDAGTPFYVDNTGDFSLGDKLKYDNSENLLTISGAVTIESVSGLTKSDVGLGNVDNTSVANILDGTEGDFTGDVTGTVAGTSASTVKSNAADGATAKGVTDNLESNVTLTSTKIYQGTGTFNNSNTGFYLDNTGQFSLKDKLSFDGTTLSVDGEITSTSGNIGGWEINSTELKSPAVSGVNRLKFSPTSGFIVNDNDNQTSLLVNYGALSSLSSTTTGVTFPDVSNAEVASFDGTVSAGNTLITIPGANERHIYSTNYLTASFPGANTGGAYSYQITVDAITQQLALLTGTSSYLKATMALHVQIATDTSFSNVIKDVELWRSNVQGNNATVNFPGVTKDISFSITNSITNVYLRFYWYRMYVVAYNDSIEFYPRTFNVSSADANDDLVFLIYKGTTELTNEGVQIINDPTTYFKVDRANFVSGNPYVDIGGDVKIDGDLEVTGSINIVGDVENSDVSASNLAQRLGEITSDITVGASSSVDVIFPGNVTFQGSVTGGDVTVSNLETRLGEIDSNINIGHSAGVTITMRENVVVTGDLTVQGNVTTENTTQLHISDSLIHLADGNENSDSIDIGFVGHYSPDSGTTKQHAGIFRDADNGEWYIFDEYVDASLDSETNPTNVIDRTDTSFSLGVVNATTFKGALQGNASTASTAGKWTNTVAISLGGTSKDLDGSTGLTWTKAELGITKATIDALSINADQLDGYGTLGSQNWFGGIPIVHTDGVMEIGKYIDFHDTDDTTDDFDYRLTSNNGSLSGSGNFSVGANTITAGTFAGDLTGDVTGNVTGNVTGDLTGNVTGNADTATTWANARTITIGDTGKLVDGSADVTWTTTEVGITKTNIDALNINADQVDGLDATDFTLDYVTDNGNSTTNEVTIKNTTYSEFGSGNTDITGLLSGSTFGTWIKGRESGHVVVGLRDNDNNDSFAILSGSGNYTTDSTYDKLLARFEANGNITLGGNTNISSGVLKIGGTTAIDSSRNVFANDVTGNDINGTFGNFGDVFLTNSSGSALAFRNSVGNTLDTNNLATVSFQGYYDNAFVGASRIQVKANENFSATARGTVINFDFWDTGSVYNTVASIDADGLYIGTTNVYDNLPDGITYSTTDNRLKIGVSKNVGSTTETAIQPILLANLLTEGYVPYVAAGGAGTSTVNSKVSDSWLKLTSDTLELGASDPVSHQIRYARFLWQAGTNDKISTVYGAKDITASIQYLGGSTTAKIEFTGGSGGGRIQFNDEYTFPATDGTSGQVLTTNGSGDLSWSSGAGNISLDDVTTVNGTTSNSISVGGLTANNLLLKGGTDSTIGTMFVWRLSNSSSTGTTWRKVCDVSLPTGNWSALSMDIVLRYPSNNFGDSASQIDFRYTASFRRSSNSQDNLDDALLYGNNPNYIRIVKTATGEYELQARAYLNNRGIIVEYMITGGNANNVTPTTTNVNGTTTGTIYTASTASYPALETTGSINIDNDTILNSNGLQGISTYTQNLFIVSSGTSAQNRIDNDGTQLYITYGGTSSTALQINNTSGDVSIQQSLGIYHSAASLFVSGDTSGNIYYNNSAGEHRFRANGSSVNSMTINSSLITLNENTEINGTLTHDGLSMTDGTGIDQLKTYTQSLTLTTGWQDTGINGTDLATGTYIFEMYTNDYGVGGGHYSERYAGIITWLDSNTNSTVADEIVISSRAGHAPNSGDIQLRILRTSSADTDDIKLQIKANYNATGASNYVFKFRRVI